MISFVIGCVIIVILNKWVERFMRKTFDITTPELTSKQQIICWAATAGIYFTIPLALLTILKWFV